MSFMSAPSSTGGRRREGRLVEQLDGAPGVVRHREHFVEIDVGAHAVALNDSVEPWTGVEGLGVLERVPLVDAAGPPAVAPDEVLADEPSYLAKSRCDPVKVL